MVAAVSDVVSAGAAVVGCVCACVCVLWLCVACEHMFTCRWCGGCFAAKDTVALACVVDQQDARPYTTNDVFVSCSGLLALWGHGIDQGTGPCIRVFQQ